MGDHDPWGHSAAPVFATTDVLGFLLVPTLQFLEKTCLCQGSGGGAQLPGALC